MGTILLRIKLMPSSPDVDLNKIKEQVKSVIEGNFGKNTRFDEEPIAFGLKAVIVSFDISEDREIEPIERKLEAIEEVSSVWVIDMRRAIG